MKINKLFTPFYFVSLIILGNFIFYNLFIAIIIKGFEELEEQRQSQSLYLLNEENYYFSSTFTEDSLLDEEKKESSKVFSFKTKNFLKRSIKNHFSTKISSTFEIDFKTFSKIIFSRILFNLLNKIFLKIFIPFLMILHLLKLIIDTFINFGLSLNIFSKFALYFEIFCFSMYFFENLLKIISNGIFFGKSAFLRSKSNYLDTFAIFGFYFSYNLSVKIYPKIFTVFLLFFLN